MEDLIYSKKTLYDLLIILCDILNFEHTSHHEEIICDFIKTIDLNGKPLKFFLEILLADKHLQTVLKHPFENLSYPAQKNILNIMEQAWPEDMEMIKRLQHAAYIIDLAIRNKQNNRTLSKKALIKCLVKEN